MATNTLPLSYGDGDGYITPVTYVVLSDQNLNKENELSNNEKRIRRFGATTTIVSTAIGGGGMFGNIFGASQLGIIGFVLITFITMIFTYLSIQFLTISSSISSSTSCYQLSYKYLGGSFGDTLTKLFIIFGNWSFCVNVIQIFADFVSYILPIWTNESESDSFFVSREFAVIIGIIAIFPWISSKSIRGLEQLSGIFLLFSILILIAIGMNAIKAVLTNNVSETTELFSFNFEQIFHGLTSITWCWTIQFNILPIYKSLNINNSIEMETRINEMKYISEWSVISLFIYYVLYGLSTMIIFGTQINDDFMTNLDVNNSNYIWYYGNELSTVTQCIMCIVTFTSIPIFAFEARVNTHYIIMDLYYKCVNYNQIIDADAITVNESSPLLTDLTQIDNKNELDLYSETTISRYIESGLIIITAAIVALLTSNVNWCLSLVGATYGCYIAYFVPSIVYYRAISNISNPSRKELLFKYAAVLSILYGIIVCILGVVTSFI